MLIVIDDLDIDLLPAYGGNSLTPHIDRLAREGVRFDRAYVTSPVCVPSRFGLLTGRFASRSKDLHALPSPDNSQRICLPGQPCLIRWNTALLPGERTLAHVLQQHGYTTGMVGKWHLDNPRKVDDAWRNYPGEAGEVTPEIEQRLVAQDHVFRARVRDNFGFDSVERFYSMNLHCMVTQQGLPEKLAFHNTEWITEGALEFIEANANQPFFLYMALTTPHWPHPVESMRADPRITPIGMLDEPPVGMPSRESVFERAEAVGLFERRTEPTWMDDSVGAVLHKLDTLDLADDTIVVFMSDHQGKGKGSLYESGVRIPMIMRWGDRLKGGAARDELVANIDLAPTLLDACGGDWPADYTVDGRSFLPMLDGDASAARSSLMLEMGFARGVVTPDHKYIAVRFPYDAELADEPGLDGRAVQYGVDELYPAYFDRDQLYDLRADPGEQRNLAADPEHATALEALRAALTEQSEKLPHTFGEFRGP